MIRSIAICFGMLLCPLMFGCGGSTTNAPVAKQDDVAAYLAEHGDQSVEDAEEMQKSKDRPE